MASTVDRGVTDGASQEAWRWSPLGNVEAWSWAVGLSDLCPLDQDLDKRMFVHQGREDLADVDLDVHA